MQAENLFFGKDGSVTFIDFQLSVVQWAAMDVAYCLGQSVEPEGRRQHELEYLELHYDALLAHPNGPKAEEYTWNHHLAVRERLCHVVSPWSHRTLDTALVPRCRHTRWARAS